MQDAAHDPGRRPSRRPSRRVLVATGAVGLVLVVWSAWAAAASRTDLLAVRDTAQRLQQDRPAGVEELLRQLAPAAQAAADARDRLDQPGPWLVSRMPVLGRALAAERDVAVVADVLLSGALPVLDALSAVPADRGVDPEAVRVLETRLSELDARARGPLADLRSAPLGLVPGPVRAAVEQAQDAVEGAETGLPRAAQAARALSGLLGTQEPRTLLVVVMNNAELRGAGGYGGSFAVVDVRAGRLRVGPFQDVNDVQDTPASARRVAAPEDFARRWGPFLADTTVWKNTLMSSDQAASAAVTCAVARLTPGVPCDGVVLLDVPALADLVELTGPVDLGTEQVTGDRLVEALLVEAYATTGDTEGDQADRRARLRRAADEAVVRLLGDELLGVEALPVLARAVQGRHLAVWSADAEEQRALTAAGLAGTVTPEGVDDVNLVSANQFSAGKLDVYVERSVQHRAVVGRTSARVVQRVELALDHPADATPYVLGVRGGVLDELVDLAVPLTAQDLVVEQDGSRADPVLAQDSGSLRVQLPVRLVDGGRTVVELSYAVPLVDGRYAVELVPQPLARDARLQLDVVAASGERLEGGEVRLDGPYDARQRVQVQLEPLSWWDRPVRLPLL